MRTVILLTAWIVMATPCWGFQDKTPRAAKSRTYKYPSP